MTLEVFPYQAEAADWLARRERAGLFDEMGIGKTATMIRALDLRRIKRGLIIVPAMIRETWRKEFRKFAQIDRRIAKGLNIHDFVAWSRGRFDTLITSYELATKWAPYIADMGEILEFLICDEFHYLKNGSAARTNKILGKEHDGIGGILQYAEQAWVATGTPMPNDPADIYTFCKFANATLLNRPQFITRYFHSTPTAYGSRQKAKLEMIPELRTLIGNNSMRRTHIDVGLQLPKIFLTTTTLDGDTTEIAALLREHPGLDRAIIDAVNQGGLSFLDAQYIMTLRRLIGEAKAVPYAEMLYSELNGGLDKAVVFGVHRAALMHVRDFLARRNIRSILVNGDTPMREKEEAETIFQSEPACRVFIGNIKAAGVGLTLTSSAALDMLESAWSPGDNWQAVKRVLRIGQTRSIRARFITLANSFDETVVDIVTDKTRAIAEVEGSPMLAAPLDAQPVAA